MRMTKTNKKWLGYALHYGYNGLHYDIFYDRGWRDVEESEVFHDLYVWPGGKRGDWKYQNGHALTVAIEIAHRIMTEALEEVEKRMGLSE